MALSIAQRRARSGGVSPLPIGSTQDPIQVLKTVKGTYDYYQQNIDAMLPKPQNNAPITTVMSGSGNTPPQKSPDSSPKKDLTGMIALIAIISVILVGAGAAVYKHFKKEG